jgi:hypothetical protein
MFKQSRLRDRKLLGKVLIISNIGAGAISDLGDSQLDIYCGIVAKRRLLRLRDK